MKKSYLFVVKLVLNLTMCVYLFFLISCKGDDDVKRVGDIPGGDQPGVEVSLDCEPTGEGKLYEVGPGKLYENIVDVPFEDLGPGDVVKIHAREQPYYERILLTESGTRENPVCICGVPDADGNLPVLDGTNARVREVQMKADVAYLAVIVVYLGNNHRWGEVPENIQIKNLHIRGANQYTGDNSQKYYVMGTDELAPYSAGAAGIRITGENILIANNIIEHNGNGIFGAFNSEEDRLRNVRLIGNVIRNNGTKDAYLQHNVYIEADSLIAVGNKIGPVRAGSIGANYKSRSAGDVIMYNKFIGPAARQLDLVEAQNGYTVFKDLASFRKTLVVGNIVLGSADGASNILHYGGDGDDATPSDDKRQGTIYCYNNTFVLRGNKKVAWRKSFADLNTCNENLYAFNNIFYYENTAPSVAEDSEISIFRFSGSVEYFENNLLTPAILDWYSTKTNGDPCGQNNAVDKLYSSTISADALKLKDLKTNDLHLQEGSAAIDSGIPVPSDLLPVVYQFKEPTGVELRKADDSIDIGAFEF